MTRFLSILALASVTTMCNTACMTPDSNQECEETAPAGAWKSPPLTGVLPERVIECKVESTDSDALELTYLLEGTAHRATMDAVGRIQALKDAGGQYAWTRTGDDWHARGKIEMSSSSTFKNPQGDVLTVTVRSVPTGGGISDVLSKKFTRTRYIFSKAEAE